MFPLLTIFFFPKIRMTTRTQIFKKEKGGSGCKWWSRTKSRILDDRERKVGTSLDLRGRRKFSDRMNYTNEITLASKQNPILCEIQ
jgi:hypothetical protein